MFTSAKALCEPRQNFPKTESALIRIDLSDKRIRTPGLSP